MFLQKVAFRSHCTEGAQPAPSLLSAAPVKQTHEEVLGGTCRILGEIGFWSAQDSSGVDTALTFSTIAFRLGRYETVVLARRTLVDVRADGAVPHVAGVALHVSISPVSFCLHLMGTTGAADDKSCK